jgi:NADH-quinone oxidoreductase subunit F
VVKAIASGKKAAVMIERFLKKEEMVKPEVPQLPKHYVEPMNNETTDSQQSSRVHTPRALANWRRRNFSEVEVSLSQTEAICETRRCLRCDLEFTKSIEMENINAIEENILND